MATSSSFTDTSEDDETKDKAKDNSASKSKKTNIFVEVNPETDGRTAFDRKLPHAGGDSKLAISESTPQEVIDRELMRNMVSSSRPTRKKTKRGCFEIVPRANPKGLVQLCEICHEPATLGCSKCTVAYYCCWEHRYLDNLHSSICKKLRILRLPYPLTNNEDHRKRLKAQRLLVTEKLVEDLVRQAFVSLYEGHFRHAQGALIQSIQYIKPVYAEDNQTLQLITIYTGISEAQIGESKLKAADKSLSIALSLLWRAEDNHYQGSLNYAHAQVNKTQGCLKYAKDNLDDALFYFSECVYYVSESSSPTDVRACVGYFNLGRCFFAKSEKDKGISVFSFCVHLWLDYLKSVMTTDIAESAKSSVFKKGKPRAMLHYLQLEATQQLEGLWEYINEEENPDVSGRVLVCRGILLYLNKEYTEARSYANRALKLQQGGSDSELLSAAKYLEKHAARKEASCMG